MLERIRALAMEKLASEEEVNAFMEGFEKEALGQMDLFGAPGFVSRMLHHPDAGRIGLGLVASLAGAAIVKGVSTGSRTVETAGLKNKFETSLAQVMSTNKLVKAAKPERVRDIAETMFRFAPHVVSDPNLLGYLLANAIDSDGTVDVRTVETLVNLEARYVDARKTNPLPGIRT